MCARWPSSAVCMEPRQTLMTHLRTKSSTCTCCLRDAASVGGDLYAATVSDFSGSDSLIIKNQLRTEQYDYKHLNGMTSLQYHNRRNK